MKQLDNHLVTAIRTSIVAGERILEVYNRTESPEVYQKTDDSPLTDADLASNAVINKGLKPSGIPIISEENKQIAFDKRKDWSSCWIVDPLDGTKEFIKRNGEFTVNIALSESGRSVFGVIFVPVSRELYYGDTRIGKAYKIELSEDLELPKDLMDPEFEIGPSVPSKACLRVVGSRSHMNADTQGYIDEMKQYYDEVVMVSKGSSLKFCLVAEGKADVYPRFAPTMEWDTAAGSAIVEAVGLQVTTQPSRIPLRYNKKELLNPYFLVHRNGR